MQVTPLQLVEAASDRIQASRCLQQPITQNDIYSLAAV